MRTWPAWCCAPPDGQLSGRLQICHLPSSQRWGRHNPAQCPTAALCPMKILIVEDEPKTGDYLQQGLA
ncbi:MAG: hypothetical protein ACLGHV_12180, partial [Gammaproteobacteria bacterium]